MHAFPDSSGPRFAKEVLISWALAIVLCLTPCALADERIYPGFFWDAAPAAAYNGADREFLVVWNVYNPFFPDTDPQFFGPVMGQIIREGGGPIGDPFEIFAAGVLADVAYNAQAKEYLVVCEQWFNTVGQRISRFGAKIGGTVTYFNNVRYPRVVYNSLDGTYLVTGAWLTETLPDLCDIELYTLPVSAQGQPAGSANKVVDEGHGPCADGAIYSLAYAPMVSAKTPQGRYLLAVGGPGNLRMLDHWGQLVLTLYNPQSSMWYPEVPFQQSKVGDAYNIDVAFGYLESNPVFLLVWGDINQQVQNYGQWTGIWGGIVAADVDQYYTDQGVSNDVFPISFQWTHYAYPQQAKEWKPQAAYNSTADTFVVAWRETPGTDPRDLTNVNHIRVNTVSSTTIPPQQNLVVSATGGTENPVLPCLAASTSSETAFIAWEDYRNILGDIYGTFFNASTRSTSVIGPSEAPKTSYWKKCAAGIIHSLGIRSDGSLWAWGDNSSGQLGLNDTSNRHSLTRVGSETDWGKADAGDRHSLGIRADGSLWAWGDNSSGQLGLNDTQNRSSPTRVGSETDWVAVTVGDHHSLGIRADRSLWAWGNNFFGQLGLNDTQDRIAPTRVGSDADWVTIDAGDRYTLGIRADGSLWAWGDNLFAQLGLNDTQDRHSPTRVGSDSDWVTVAVGDYHSLGTRADGSLWAWGSNFYSQLGLEGTLERHIPTLVLFPLPAMPWIQLLLLD